MTLLIASTEGEDLYLMTPPDAASFSLAVKKEDKAKFIPLSAATIKLAHHELCRIERREETGEWTYNYLLMYEDYEQALSALKRMQLKEPDREFRIGRSVTLVIQSESTEK